MIEEKYRQLAEIALASVKGIQRTGVQVLELRDRYFKTLMPLKGNTNHVGIMYAGSLFTIGELTGGLLHLNSFDINKFFPIVKEINIRFVRPVLTDVTLEYELPGKEAERIQAEAETKGKADYDLDLEIKDAQDQVVALVHGLWQIRKFPEGMANPFQKS